MPLLVLSEIWGLFANTLNADHKYSLRKDKNLLELIQTHLSKKLKIFSEVCALFLKSTWNFKQFGSKDDPHSLCILEITDCKRRA